MANDVAKLHKVVSSLPVSPEADSIYFVRVGSGFDIYVTNHTGTVVPYALNGGAAIGAQAPRISKQFQTPLSCGAGRFVHVILRMPVGSATASQVIAGMVNIEGYFE